MAAIGELKSSSSVSRGSIISTVPFGVSGERGSLRIWGFRFTEFRKEDSDLSDWESRSMGCSRFMANFVSDFRVKRGEGGSLRKSFDSDFIGELGENFGTGIGDFVSREEESVSVFMGDDSERWAGGDRGVVDG